MMARHLIGPMYMWLERCYLMMIKKTLVEVMTVVWTTMVTLHFLKVI